MTPIDRESLDANIRTLATRDRALAASLLKEVVRIPADHVDRSADEGGDPLCGTSNHEGPRLEYLKRRIVEIGAVRHPDDVGFDTYGNLVWSVEDPDDGVPRDEKRIIYLDGHADTVAPLRGQWIEKIGGGVDVYDGLVDAARTDRGFLRDELGYLPPDDEWGHLIFGRGSADQLGGVIAEVVATRILLELVPLGALRGAIVRAYATAAEEDNDGGGPRYLVEKVFPTAPPNEIPDVVILTEGTGDANKGALGIYRGQRGRMQIEVDVLGKSCHGSMPWMGRNPLEHGGAILAEAARAYEARVGFLDDPFLSHGTRTASFAELKTPSDCAVPDRFTFRFDRRLTIGETAEQAIADVEALDAVAAARAAGLTVNVCAPTYERPTWRGYRPGNPQVYPGWVTPADHPTISTAAEVYRRVVSPQVPAKATGGGGRMRSEPRVDRWIFSTDGVGFPVPAADTRLPVSARKRWVVAGAVKFPAMFGLGPGIEQNTHKIGECVDARELEGAIAFLAGFPAAFAAT